MQIQWAFVLASNTFLGSFGEKFCMMICLVHLLFYIVTKRAGGVVLTLVTALFVILHEEKCNCKTHKVVSWKTSYIIVMVTMNENSLCVLAKSSKCLEFCISVKWSADMDHWYCSGSFEGEKYVCQYQVLFFVGLIQKLHETWAKTFQFCLMSR